MRLSILLLLICSISFTIQGQEEILEEINKQLELSEKAIKGKIGADQALFHAVQAENLIVTHRIDDPTILRSLYLKFIGAFYNMDQKKDARQYLKKLLKIYQFNEGFESIEYALNAGRLGTDYLHQNELDSAYTYFNKCVQATKKNGNRLFISSALNNMGMYYLKAENLNLAQEYFYEALSTLEMNTINDSMLWVSINDNIADYYFIKKDTLNGIKILERNVNLLINNTLRYEKIIRFTLELCEYLVIKKEFKKAEKFLSYLEDKLSKGASEKYLDHLIDYYELKLALVQSNNQLEEQLNQHRIIDSIRKEIILKGEKSRRDIDKSMKEYLLRSATNAIAAAEIEVEETRKNDQLKTILFVTIFIVLIGVGLFTIVNYNRELKLSESDKKLKEKELKLTELENEKLLWELHHQSNDFSDLSMQISLKEDWNQEIISKLETLRQENTSIEVNEINMLIRELKQKSKTYDKVSIHQKGINEVNSAFFGRLDQKFPNLSKSERELCGLIRLRLEGKEIAVIRNIHPSSVRKLRHRLRKKLQISAQQDIYEFIAKV